MGEVEREISIRDLIKSVLRCRVLIIALTLVALIGSAVVSFVLMTPKFTANASIYVLNQQNVEMISVNDLSSSAQLVNDYRQIMLSDRVFREVAKTFGLSNLSAYDIDVVAVQNTRVMEISVTGESPHMCANIANELAGKSAQAVIDIMDVQNVSFIDVAYVPLKPSAPEKEKNIAIATLAGLMLGVGIAIAKELFDTSLKTTEDVEDELGLPVLAMVPRFEAEKKKEEKGA